MQSQEVIEGWRGVMVSIGLGHPMSRAVSAGIVTAGVTYALKFPSSAFRANGQMRPYRGLSSARDGTSASQHFLLTPLAVGTAVYLFT